MKINAYNDGENAVRVIIDHDTVNDSTLEPGEERLIESEAEGVIEFRELGATQGDLASGAQT